VSKTKTNIKKITTALGKSYIWLFTLIGCMILAIYLVICIGAFLQSDLVYDVIDAAYSFRKMTIASYFNGQFFRWVSEMDEWDIAVLAKLLSVLMVVSYGLYVGFVGIHAVIEKDIVHKQEAKTSLGVIALITFANFVLEVVIIGINKLWPALGSETLAASNKLATGGGPLMTILFVGILAPIVEELLFRRGMQKNLDAINPKMSLIVTALSFGLLHGNILQSSFAIAMGLILGYVYQKTDNLLYTIMMHISVNMTGVLIELLGLNEIMTYAGAAIISAITYFYYLYRNGEMNNIKKLKR